MWLRAKLKFVAHLGYGDAMPSDESQDGAFRVFGSNGPFASFSRVNTGAPAIVIGRKGSYGKVNWTAEPCFASDTTFFVDETTSRNHLRWIYWLEPPRVSRRQLHLSHAALSRLLLAA